MFSNPRIVMVCGFLTISIAPASTSFAQQVENDPVRVLVDRLELESYKSTLKGLTQFGDRRQAVRTNLCIEV